MKRTVMCIVQLHSQAEAIVEQLQASGFARDDISVLLPNKNGTRDFAHVHSTKAPEGAVAGAGAGGALGGALGVLLGIGALAIPGLGPLIVAGPLLAALSGVAAGAAVGGVAGALIGMGIPEMEAKRFEGKIKGGNLLISVHTDSSEDQRLVKEIFKLARAEDICSSSEASIPRQKGDEPLA
jgi:hypothetical protein